jgi:hypothetical protein
MKLTLFDFFAQSGVPDVCTRLNQNGDDAGLLVGSRVSFPQGTPILTDTLGD